MAKEGFEAARNAAQAAGSAPPAKGKSALGSHPKTYTQLTGPAGKVYLLEESQLEKLQTLSTTPNSAGFAGLVTDEVPAGLNEVEWEGWMAIIEEEIEPMASVDWQEYSHKVNQPCPTTIAPLNQDLETVLATTAEHPFFVDLGATVHISPCKSNFLTLQPITPKAIKGVGGSAISACGIGCIQLRTAEGTMVPLRNALYVPNSTVRLISTYRCWDKNNRKVYQSYHIKFIERHETENGTDSPPLPSVKSNIPPIPSLQELNDASPLTPQDNDDDLSGFDINEEAQETKLEQNDADPTETAGLRRSSRVRQPTEKVAGDTRRPPTRLERAVEELRQSGQRIKEQRMERRIEGQESNTAEMEAKDEHQAPLTIESNDQQAPAPNPEVDHDRILAAILTQFSDIDPLPSNIEEEPRTWEEAKRGPDAEKWEEGYREEMKSLKEMGVYQLIPRSEVPKGQKVRKGRPIFKIKKDKHGNPVRYKVQLVFKGYEQIYGKDYNKTTSPTACMESWQILLHIAATEGWDMTQINIKTAFLYGLLPDDKVQYMEQPEGFKELGKEDWVCELVQGLYGMKQAGRIWNRTMNERMLSWGFTRLACESCIYYRKSTTGTVIAAVHVDDFLSIASSKDENDRLKSQMRSVWTISDLGTPRYLVGVSVEWDRMEKTVALSQTAFIDRVVQQFGQKDAYPLLLPMDPGTKL
ncbi:hypothetical protein E4T56_gene12595 [Termitomyces sp. T112]|nr:hypothetical protein E4T56_gene12595 [Termitomyces sp. T112]